MNKINRIEDASTILTVGETVEAKYMSVDKKTRSLSLSIRAKDESEEKKAIASLKKQEKTVSNAMSEAFKAARSE